MYSGTTFHSKSGRVMGVHQRIDRLAKRNLKKLQPGGSFPPIKEILHFEGRGGPDGLKSKNPGADEPWHFINPANPADEALYTYIDDHLSNLIDALKADNRERAAFEAAWLAHAVVDGLTPAHHYPLAETIEQLWGKPREARLTVRDKNIIRGDGRRDTLRRNWQYWGARGVWTTHYMFELGFAASTARLSLESVEPTAEDIKRVETGGFLTWYKTAVQTIYRLGMYEEYYKKGWTRHLARESREVVAPLLIAAVTLAWYEASRHAEVVK